MAGIRVSITAATIERQIKEGSHVEATMLLASLEHATSELCEALSRTRIPHASQASGTAS